MGRIKSKYFYKPYFIPPELRGIILNYLQHLYDYEIYQHYEYIITKMNNDINNDIEIKKKMSINDIKDYWEIEKYTNKCFSIKYYCNCGSYILISSKNKHIKTNKHIKYISK